MDDEVPSGRPQVLLFHNNLVVTMDPDLRVHRNGALAVEADRIKAIGHSSQLLPNFSPMPDQIFDLNDRIFLPGFINTHVHTSQQVAREIDDDVDLLRWLCRIWPFESNMTKENSFISSLLCGIELIHFGVTCLLKQVDSMSLGWHGWWSCLAYVRAQRSPPWIPVRDSLQSGHPTPLITAFRMQYQMELYQKRHNTADGCIRVWFGLSQIMNSTDPLLLETRDAAKELQTGIHIICTNTSLVTTISFSHVAEIEFENKVVVDT